jgi:hypothetical protein
VRRDPSREEVATVDGHAQASQPNSHPRAGRDRPQLHPGRTRRINPSFTDDEHAEVMAAARRSGLTATGFCAVAALTVARGAAAAAVPDRAQFEALAGLQAELFDARTAIVRTGTNLNQAVAALHSTGEPPAWLDHAVTRCAHTLTALDELISRVHRRLQ